MHRCATLWCLFVSWPEMKCEHLILFLLFDVYFDHKMFQLLIDFNHKLDFFSVASALFTCNSSTSECETDAAIAASMHNFCIAIYLFLFYISLCSLSRNFCIVIRPPDSIRWNIFRITRRTRFGCWMLRLLMKSRKDYCISSIDTLAKRSTKNKR